MMCGTKNGTQQTTEMCHDVSTSFFPIISTKKTMPGDPQEKWTEAYGRLEEVHVQPLTLKKLRRDWAMDG